MLPIYIGVSTVLQETPHFEQSTAEITWSRLEELSEESCGTMLQLSRMQDVEGHQ